MHIYICILESYIYTHRDHIYHIYMYKGGRPRRDSKAAEERATVFKLLKTHWQHLEGKVCVPPHTHTVFVGLFWPVFRSFLAGGSMHECVLVCAEAWRCVIDVIYTPWHN